MEPENIKVTEFFVADKQVKEVKALEDQTPLKDVIFEVTYSDDSKERLTRAKFEAIRLDHKSDATTARNLLVKEIGQKLYAIMCEYGLLMSEIDPTLNEVVRLTNDNQNHALEILWGVPAYDRSLLDVNRVLLSKYDPATEQEVTPESGDATPSDGGSPDSEDKD